MSNGRLEEGREGEEKRQRGRERGREEGEGRRRERERGGRR